MPMTMWYVVLCLQCTQLAVPRRQLKRCAPLRARLGVHRRACAKQLPVTLCTPGCNPMYPGCNPMAAPASSSCRTKPATPLRAAWCSAVAPCRSIAPTTAPAANLTEHEASTGSANLQNTMV